MSKGFGCSAEDECQAFGPEFDLPEDAPVDERMAGFFGHRAG